MNAIKNTTLLEAVAAVIQHEKDCFDFYLDIYEKVKEGSVKDFFKELAEDVEEHIKLIQEMYNDLSGGVEFPNLKQLTAIHKFDKTHLTKLMRKIDRNTEHAFKDDIDAVQRAMQVSEDAREFASKMKEKFKDPAIKSFFNKLAFIKEEERIMAESQYLFLQQTDKTKYYWEDDSLVNSK
ncbi:MAG TPA: ferritin family protein [Leptospiraceae bacterium]|nr:ferritin family protein [Leptospiraceae bacterium]HMW06532.1 ferritin family protein [Leptospiraceae bacterium]HMX35286.1 ferritin family protein [Leptospiraceae bacterium]HMY32830.1 ferritin family protein [Leptospiraceae bacterium]HMZ65325.1 ferritin family protein [Leptospiraceae bacterium]